MHRTRMPSRPADARSWDGPVLAAVAFAALALLVAVVWDSSGRQVVDFPLYRLYGERMVDGLVPYRDFALEYPPLALSTFLLPALLTAGDGTYPWAFSALMALCGGCGVLAVAASLRLLGRSPAAERRVLALLALSPLLLGAILLARFDLLPAALSAAAMLLLLAGRARGGALVLGLGIAAKLYPFVLLPLLAAWAWRRAGRREAVIAVALSLGTAVAVYLPFLAVSPDGVASSVGRQIGRPLQIESLGSGVLLGLHQLGMPLGWESSHGSQNLTGGAAVALAVLLSVAQPAVLVWVWVRFARGPAEPERLVRFAAAALVAVVALGKVLSPQFLVWLLFALPLVAGRPGRSAATLYAAACALTAVWFPVLYWDLVREFDTFASLLVLARDLLLVGVLVVLLSATAREPAPARSRSPDPLPSRT
jgi:hypothetical protein